MNEQLKGFLKKASEDGPLKEELGALAGLPEEERAERAAAIAREAGFDVSVEDFAVALIDEAESPTHRQARFTVASNGLA